MDGWMDGSLKIRYFQSEGHYNSAPPTTTIIEIDILALDSASKTDIKERLHLCREEERRFKNDEEYSKKIHDQEVFLLLYISLGRPSKYTQHLERLSSPQGKFASCSVYYLVLCLIALIAAAAASGSSFLFCFVLGLNYETGSVLNGRARSAISRPVIPRPSDQSIIMLSSHIAREC